MRLSGYSRRRLDRPADVEAVFEAVAAIFGPSDFEMEAGADHGIEQTVAFSSERGVRALEDEGVLGFFRKNVVGVGIDNQAYKNSYFVYPHALVQIETMKSQSGSALTMDEWLSLAERLTGTTGLDLAFVMGAKENTADYYRTPLGCGIGLIKVFWINCFGGAYSELIQEGGGTTCFFRREKFGASGRAFVSAASYEAYRSASPELLASQKRELGEELFHRLPAEELGQGGAYSAVSARAIFRFLRLLYRQWATDGRQHQARIVPRVYRRENRAVGLREER